MAFWEAENTRVRATIRTQMAAITMIMAETPCTLAVSRVFFPMLYRHVSFTLPTTLGGRHDFPPILQMRIKEVT